MRRLISLCLIIMLTLSLNTAAFYCGQSSGESIISGGEKAFDFYIIRFKDGYDCKAAEAVGGKALGGNTYRVDASALEILQSVCKGGILYAEPDAVRTLCEVDGTQDEAKPIGDVTPADASGIVVAVLDTGIYREHTGFAGVTITGGYDCIEHKPYISDDMNGHGTKVAGIIASYAQNVTIMPIRVATSHNMIYSSDLIYALRYAADNGADIINMSFGGYTYSYAEQDAINYALEKGCIPIAASGNDGLTALGGNESYPASYDGVISVGSVSKDGNLSPFSQESSNVDISACGEKVPVFEKDGLGTDSGTSFSCAVISALAASCKKAAGGARFGFDEMLAIINGTCGWVRFDGLGFGTADTTAMLSESRLPIITGIRDGGVYNLGTVIRFNSGNAVLDGEDALDGDAVLTSGPHMLTVTNENGRTDVRFIISAANLGYTYTEYGDHAEFVFENGFAFLDGFPYVSGTPITQSGDHVFLIEDEYGRTAGETVCPTFGLNLINGVSDGGTYFTPVHITACKPFTLNGKQFESEAWVYDSGSYTLVMGSKTVSFALDTADIRRMPLGKAKKIAVSEQYSVTATYSQGTGGFYLYSLQSGERIKYIFSEDIVNCHSYGDTLYVVCRNAIHAYKFDSLLSDEPQPYITFVTEDTVTASEISGGVLYFISGDFLYSFDGEETLPLTEVNENFDFITVSGGKILMCCVSLDGSAIMLYDTETAEVSTVRLGANLIGKDLLLTADSIICGGKIFDTEGGLIATVQSDGPLLNLNGTTVTRFGAYASCEISAEFEKPLTDAEAGENALYLFDGETLTVFPVVDGKVNFGEVRTPLFESSELTPDFSLLLASDHKYLDITAGDGMLYMIFDGIQSLFVIDSADMKLVSAHHLDFLPQTVQYSDGRILMSFKNTAMYAQYSDGGISYVKTGFIPERLFACGEYVFSVSGGKIVRVNGDGEAETFASASHIAVSDGLLYSTDKLAFTCFNPADMSVIYTLSLASEAESLAVQGGYAFAGGNIIDTALGSITAATDAPVHCFIHGFAVTASGVRRASDAKVYNATKFSHAITDGRYVFIDGKAGLIRVDASVLSGFGSSVSNGALYDVSTQITFDGGIGYLDGVRVFGGETVSEGGNHIFMQCLPLGITERYAFSIVPALSGIEINSHTRVISTGDTLQLRVKFLPEGASSVPLHFSADSDIVTVSESGMIHANAGGDVNITVRTDDGRFSAVYTLKISDSALKLKDGSIPQIDRENSVIYAIPAGTYAFQLINMSAVDGEIKILTADGYEVNGILKTGMKLVHSIGDGTEEFTLAVSGDIDGDGVISTLDLSMILSLLASPDSGTFVQRTAADINQSGTLTGYDMAMIKSQLLRQRMFCPFPPVPEDKLNNCLLYSSVKTNSDGYIYLSLTSSQAISGLSGMIDVSGAKFDKLIYACGECETHVGDGFVSFIIKEAETDGGIILIRFTLDGDKAEFGLRSAIAAVGDRTYALPALRSSTMPYAKSHPLEISIANALNDVELEDGVYEYTVFVPKSTMFADVSVSLPATVSGVVLNSEGGTVTVSVGKKPQVFTIHVVKIDHTPSKENRLRSLIVGEYTLSPAFSPDVTEYVLTLPAGTKPPKAVYELMEGTAKATSAEFADRITITVRSEYGSEKMYTIEIVYEKDDPSQAVSIPPESRHGISPMWLLLLVPVALLAATAAILKRRNKN